MVMSMSTSTSSSNMGSMIMSATASSAMSTSTAMSTSMDMGGNDCKISMLWNWYTVDACFLSSTWQITSSGMFAGSCIGVIFLVISLEFLRRVGREYDAYLRRQSTYQRMREPQNSEQESLQEFQGHKSTSNVQTNSMDVLRPGQFIRIRLMSPTTLNAISQQAVRAAIHMVQFAVAYFIMLLAMYYNGYIIICIIIGAFFGAFVFSWDQIQVKDRSEPADVTGCCG